MTLRLLLLISFGLLLNGCSTTPDMGKAVTAYGNKDYLAVREISGRARQEYPLYLSNLGYVYLYLDMQQPAGERFHQALAIESNQPLALSGSPVWGCRNILPNSFHMPICLNLPISSKQWR